MGAFARSSRRGQAVAVRNLGRFGGGKLRASTALCGALMLSIPGIAHAQAVEITGPTEYNVEAPATGTTIAPITGAGSVIKTGTGLLIFAGDNTYAGTTTISAGTLQVGVGGTSGSLGLGDVINNGVLAFRRSDTQTVNNLISGTGSVNVLSGTVVLTGNNTYGGGTTLSGGTLEIAQAGAIGAGALTLSGGNLRFTNGAVVNNNLTLIEGTTNRISAAAGQSASLMGPVILYAGTLRFGSATDTGTINWQLNGGSFDPSMQLFVDGGTLRNLDGNVGYIATYIARTEVASGATLDFNGFEAGILNLQGAGTVLNNGQTTTITNGNFSGTIGGTQVIDVTGNLTLSGANTYTGATTIESGAVLTVSNNLALGGAAAGTTVLSGGSLQLQGDINSSERLTLNGTGVSGSGALRNLSGENLFLQTITLGSAARINSDAGYLKLGSIEGGGNSLTFGGAGDTLVSGPINNIISLTKDGSGYLVLSSVNSGYFPTLINGGTLQLSSGDALSDLAPVIIGDGRLAINVSETIGSVSGAGELRFTGANGAVVTLTTGVDNTNTTYQGAIVSPTVTGNLVKAGTGIFTLTGFNTYTGTTTISEGTLQIGNGGTIGSLGTGNVVNNATLAFNRSDAVAVGNLISGSGSVVKDGSGTLRLTGTNAYAGGTVINAGTLEIGSAGEIGYAAITLAGGTLRGVSTTTLSNGIEVSAGTTSTISAAAGTTLTLNPSYIKLERNLPATVLRFGSAADTGTVVIGGSGAMGLPLSGSFEIDVAGGTLRAADGRVSFATMEASKVTIRAGATLNMAGMSGFIDTIEGDGTLNSDSSVIVENGTFGGSITGSGLFRAGLISGLVGQTHVVRLTGTNTYTGGTIVGLDGTLELGGTGSILGNVTGTDNGILRFARTGEYVFGGALTGTLSIQQTGPAKVTLTGSNTYTGATSIYGGALQIGNGGTTGTLGSGSVTNNAALVFNRADTLTVANQISGVGTLTMAGTGTLALTGANTYSGGTTLQSGTVEINNPGALGSGAIQMNGGSLRSTASGTLNLNFYWNSVNSILSAASGTELTLSRSTILGSGANALRFGSATDTGRIVLAGNGQYFIPATDDSLIVEGGTLQAAAGNSTLSFFTEAVGTTRINAGATLDFNSYAGTVLNLQGAGTLTNSAVTTVQGGNFSGSITGSGGLAKTGSGTLVLSGTGTFAGGSTLSGGTVQLGNTAALSSGAIVLQGGSLRSAVSGSLNNVLAWNSATSVISAAAGTVLNLTGGMNLVSGANVLRFGSATDTGRIVYSGPGLIAGGAADDMLVVEGGTLAAGDDLLSFYTGSIGATRIEAGATLDFNGYFGSVGNLQGAGTLANSISTTILAGNFSGSITGTGGLTKITLGTLVLTGTNTYTGATNILGSSTVQVGDGGTAGTLGTGAILNEGNLIINRAGTLEIASTISGVRAITKTGSGTLLLTGDNGAGSDFTGLLTVSSGKLVVNGSFGDSSANLAQVSIEAGGSLGGSGTILGSVTSNGAIGAGNSPGTLTIAGDLTLGAGNVLNFELGEAGTVGGLNNDLIVVGGNLTLDGTLNVVALPTFGNGYYRLIDYGGTLTDNGLELGSLPSGYTTTLLTNIDGQVNVLFGDGAQATQYWDGADSTGGSGTAAGGNGGAGTWSTAGTNWTAADGYAVNDAWGGQVAVFGGASGGNVSVVGTQSFQELRFVTDGYALSGATAADGLATTGGFSVIDVSTGMGATIEAGISGTGGLTKTGIGTLTLAGANTYAGTTTVSAGTLVIASGGSLAGNVVNAATLTSNGTINGDVTNTGTMNLSGQLNGALANAGAVTLTGATTGITALTQDAAASLNLMGFDLMVGSMAGAGTIQLGGATLTMGGDGSSTTFAGVILGNGGLTKTGTGTFTLTGANTYAGMTTVSAGTLVIASGGSLAGNVVNAATLTSNGTINGDVTNTGTMNLSGQLNGALANVGAVTLTGATTGITALTQDAAASLDLMGFDLMVGSIAGAGTIQLGSAMLTAGGNDSSTTFAGVISGDGGLTKTGTGNLTLAGANTYTGTTTIADGTLAVASGGSLAGNVSNAGTFLNAGTVDGSAVNSATMASTGTINGDVTNLGALNLSGQLNGALANAGAITLTGATTGVTMLEQDAAGSLDLAGFDVTVGSIAGAGTIQLGGATLTTGGNDLSTAFAGAISGSGGLTKTGTGTFALTSANGYTGTTTIADGTLQLGDGGTAGSIAGEAIENNGVLAISRSDALTLEQAISGSGGLWLAGSGTTTLTGTNTYSGGTLVSAGRLLGNAASLQGNIENNAVLEFAQDADGAYAGSLSGAGGLAKSGDGRLVLSGDSALFTGATAVLGGELSVNGLLSQSVVTIGSGGVLSGNGAVGGISASAGSVVAPGNSVGTLMVNGNVQLAAGSIYQAEVSPAGADLIDASGTAQLAGTLALTNLGGSYRANTTYVLVRADAGREGTFDTTTGLDSFGSLYRPSIVYTGNEVQLYLAANQLSAVFGDFSGTPNQMSVVGGLDAAILGGYDPQPLAALYGLDSRAERGRALDQLSGGIYPTAVRAVLDDGRLVREGAINRLREAQDTGLSGAGMWGQAVGSWGGANSDGNGLAYDQDRKGLLAGIDFGNASEEGSWRIGFYAHLLDTNLTARSLGSQADIDRKGLGAYAGLDLGHFRARAGISYSDVKLDARRAVVFTGFSDNPHGKTDGDSLQGFGEIGYRVIADEHTFLEPFVAASVESLDLDAFEEMGGAASLSVSKQENTFATATLGLRGATEIRLSDANRLRLGAATGAQRNFGDTRITSTVALNDAPDFGFPVSAVRLEPWMLAMSASAALDIGDNFTAGIGYSGLIGGSAHDHGVKATLGFRF